MTKKSLIQLYIQYYILLLKTFEMHLKSMVRSWRGLYRHNM